MTVERAGKTKSCASNWRFPVDPNPVRTLGLVMKMGPITAVQANSPAAAAGVRPGRHLVKVDGRPVDDPMRLPDQLARRAGKTVELTLERKGSKTPVVLSMRLRKPLSFFAPELVLMDSPLEVGALESPTGAQRGRAGGRRQSGCQGQAVARRRRRAGAVAAARKTLQQFKSDQAEISVPFGERDRNWPALCNALQDVLPGTVVRLTVVRDGKERWTALEPVEVADWHSPKRGFVFDPLTVAHRATSIGNALKLGGRETLEQLTMVFRSVKKLSTHDVSPRAGRPLVHHPDGDACRRRRHGQLLQFLTFLSANLAILNFLPIPLLDGGLMMFLIYEGIRGKPANEHVQVVLTYIGLAFIIGLMVWVMGLDFGLIPRRSGGRFRSCDHDFV